MVTAGFIGLGSQGGGMARRLVEQGIPTTLWARRPEALEPFAGGATLVTDPAELGRRSDVVGICVTDGAAVREVTVGPNGVLAGMAADSVLAVHSTIGTDECREIALAAGSRGVSVIDAPVSGGGAAAAAGKLTVYVGGDHEAVDRARPVLGTYGDPVLHMGALGAGLRTKLLNNALYAAHFALAHDAMAIGQHAGLDRELLAEALRNGSGRSFALEILVGWGDLAGFARQAGAVMSKDVALFAGETTGEPDRDLLSRAADRFVELIEQGLASVKGDTE